MARTSTFAFLAPSLILATFFASAPALAQQGAPPYTTDNGVSACVQFGSCTTAGGNGVITATQNGPITPPAGTPALATLTTLDSSFISSLAAAGASSAYNAQGGSGGGAGGGSPAPLTITSTVSSGRATATAKSGGSGSASASATGLGSLGSPNAASTVSCNSAATQLLALSFAAVLGAALLL